MLLLLWGAGWARSHRFGGGIHGVFALIQEVLGDVLAFGVSKKKGRVFF